MDLVGPFAHAQNTQPLAVERGRRQPDPGVTNRQDNEAIGNTQGNEHLGSPRVLGDVGQRFLEDAVDVFAYGRRRGCLLETQFGSCDDARPPFKLAQ